MKNQALFVVRSNLWNSHKEMKLLHSQNALLNQQLADSMSSSLETVLKSFENALNLVEYFHHPLILSREEIWMD